MEVPRAWLVGLGVILEGAEGRGIEGPLRDNLVLGIEVAVGTDDFVLIDWSETGGDGGVGASEMPEEEAVFAGGVSKVGEDALVVVGDNSDRGDAEILMGCKVRFFRTREVFEISMSSLFLVMSASTLRSESSSLKR